MRSITERKALAEKWNAKAPLTPDEMRAVGELEFRGDVAIVPDEDDERRAAFLKEHGHKPASQRMVLGLMEGAAEITAEAIRPLRRRIEALEAEVRAGHERIKALEAGQGAGDGSD